MNSNLVITEEGILIDASFKHPVFLAAIGGVEEVWNRTLMKDQQHFMYLATAKTYK